MINPYINRKYIIGGIVIFILFIYFIKLFAIQVIDDKYKLSAENNSKRIVIKHSARGLIFDRNNKLLVYNEAAYDIMIIPNQIENFDTITLSDILGITQNNINKNIIKARNYSARKPSIFLKQVSAKTYANFQEHIHKYKGFFVQPRTLRKYPMKIASNVLGDVGEVNKKTIEKDNYYKSGDYIGLNGIEKFYEKELRGRKGVELFLVDVHNRIKGSFANGKYDTTSVVGKNITATIDANLQLYGEMLMQNKIGSIVAIEPKSGEILAQISSPTFDPNLLVGRVRSENYQKLVTDTLKPLFNRALMAKYPPGSTFKLINALIGLQDKLISKKTHFGCSNGYHAGGLTVGCHSHKSPLNLLESIQHSCNSYYCNVFRTIVENKDYIKHADAYTHWRNLVVSFGLGNKLGSDFYNEISGFVPKASYYDKVHQTENWKALNIISLAIGQGELGITPLQMANMTATIANKGRYYIPHIVKKIEGRKDINPKYTIHHYTKIDEKHFTDVINGMELVVNGGIGSTARIAKIQDITVCGKTGTAENPHGKDHSIFIAFAPKENPEIALVVFIENGGFGSSWAAPIASLMIEKYLTDTIKRTYLEKRMLDGNLLKSE